MSESKPTGYSGKPLALKLGLRADQRVYPCNCPMDYRQLVAPAPPFTLLRRPGRETDVIHLFTTSAGELKTALERLLPHLYRDGMIWVSWPKKSSGVVSDVTEDTVRAIALPLGLVDVKVCAVDQTWSALKLVIRKELR